MQIPRIIHQTWKTETVPPEWQPLVTSWRRFHPDWEYRFWTNESGREFVASCFPEFLPTYDAYSYGIQRADALRYLLLYHYGGLYADMDMECLQPFDRLISRCQLLLGREPSLQAQDHGYDSLVCNALIASVPGHPFWSFVVAKMRSSNPRILTHVEVLDTTGPLMLQSVLDSYTAKDISLAPAHAFCPLTNNDPRLSMMSDPIKGEAYRQQLVKSNSYAIHYWANSWMTGLAGELINPEPNNIPGFTFYQGVDSPGHDLENHGRNIAQLAAICRNNPSVVAFNTDGFTKSSLLPRDQWIQMPGDEPDVGLYVRNGYSSD